jgi:hypothetical protein
VTKQRRRRQASVVFAQKQRLRRQAYVAQEPKQRRQGGDSAVRRPKQRRRGDASVVRESKQRLGAQASVAIAADRLADWNQGDPDSLTKLMPLVFDDLRAAVTDGLRPPSHSGKVPNGTEVVVSLRSAVALRMLARQSPRGYA